MSDVPHDPLDVSAILATGTVAEVESYESIDSTHTRAHERARQQSARLPLLIVAEEQTAGRGRGQNRWWTGRGSLALSLVLDPADWALAGDVLPGRALAVGVAIVETIQPHLESARAGLHWPNDVFVEGRKIAGVLVDVLADGRHVIGIGLNVNNPISLAPPDVQARATSLGELAGRHFDRTELLCNLLATLRSMLQASAEAPEAFGARFDALCLQVGRPLTIDTAGRETRGTCSGIAPDGALLLTTDAGPCRIYSGVVRADAQ